MTDKKDGDMPDDVCTWCGSVAWTWNEHGKKYYCNKCHYAIDYPKSMKSETDKKDGDIINWRKEWNEDCPIVEFIDAMVEKQNETTEKRVREEMIAELETIEKEKWHDAEHCSCLGYAIFKMKCNCDNECGKCRLEALKSKKP